MNRGTKRALSLALAAVATTVILAWGAIAIVPQTLYFPAVEYDFPGDIHFATFRRGELDRASCERAVSEMSASVVKSCPQCRPETNCVKGLDAERRIILSNEPLPMPSARNSDVTMTMSSRDPALALQVCRLLEQQSVSQAASRLRCYPPQSAR